MDIFIGVNILLANDLRVNATQKNQQKINFFFWVDCCWFELMKNMLGKLYFTTIRLLPVYLSSGTEKKPQLFLFDNMDYSFLDIHQIYCGFWC